MGFFELAHGIPPGGEWECELTPESLASIQKQAVESILNDLNASTISGVGSYAGNYHFSVDDIRLHIFMVEAHRFNSGTYYLDLKNTRCQVSTMATNCTGLSQKTFNVQGNTTALALAFQDQLAGVDTRRSSTKFKIRPTPQAPDGQDMLLKRFFLNYNNLQQPCPDYDGRYTFDPRSNVTQSQCITHRYVENLLQTNAYHSEGGAESLADFVRRGMFHFFLWPKDVDERSTQVNVNYQFETPFGVGEEHQVLLFNQWRSTFRITHKNGQVDTDQIKEM